MSGLGFCFSPSSRTERILLEPHESWSLSPHGAPLLRLAKRVVKHARASSPGRLRHTPSFLHPFSAITALLSAVAAALASRVRRKLKF